MRKNKINVFLIATLFICSMFSITGCQKEEVYIPVTVDTIEILEDGSITEYIVEPFEKEYYDIEGLAEMVSSEIAEFNKETANQFTQTERSPIRVEKVVMAEDGSKTAVVALNYENSKIGEAYRGNTLFYGTVQEALNAGYVLGNKLQSVKKKQDFTAEKQKQYAQNKILIFKEELIVRPIGKVEYLSTNAKMTNQGFVRCTADEELKYIIFK